MWAAVSARVGNERHQVVGQTVFGAATKGLNEGWDFVWDRTQDRMSNLEGVRVVLIRADKNLSDPIIRIRPT